MRRIVVLTVLVALSLACGTTIPTSAPTPDIAATSTIGLTFEPASTSQPEAATATPAVPQPDTPTAAPTISNSGINLTVPPELGDSKSQILVPESLDPQAPIWDIHPAYAEITLEGYPLQEKFFRPQILVYPAAEFEKANEGAAQIISDLKTLLAAPPDPLPGSLPFLPLFNAAQIFHANEQFLKFQNGSGVRFLTQFGQDAMPVNNHDLLYTFQGITGDGAYYISVILPVNASFLMEFPSPEFTLPPDGIPFPWGSYDTLGEYYRASVRQLNDTAPDAFTPSLTTLDTLVQSLLVTGIP